MRQLMVSAGMALLLGASIARAGQIDSGLEAVLEQSSADETISVLVYLDRQVDTDGLTARLESEGATPTRRHETVVTSLRDLAEDTQAGLIEHLERVAGPGGVADFEAFWIGNIVRVDATPATVRMIAGRDDVATVYLNYAIELIEPANRGTADPLGPGEPEIGLQAVRAPEVWALGLDGDGMLVANMDTGVDGDHQALKSRWAGAADPRYAGHPEWAWRDDVNDVPTIFPSDGDGHGSHTMGTICGGAPGDEIGVAPGARWIASNTINQGVNDGFIADVIATYQWCADPDGDASTLWDVPVVCSNSWGINEWWGIPPCDETFWVYLDQCEAAGCMIVFAAGNEAFDGIRRPADRATDDYRTLCVAAVDAHDPAWPIADFSSRGPTYCTPDQTEAIKPDIAAPGVDVRSAVPGGGYADNSGTSMACPHIAGVAALMRQANPELSFDTIKQIMFDTAYDLGDPGEDNTYGWGMVDAYESVMTALQTATISFAFPDGRPDLIDPAGGTTIRVVVNGHASTPQPGTGKLYYDIGNGFEEIAMTEVEDNVYDAVFPAIDCGSLIQYYFSAETTDSQVVTVPYLAPNSSFAGLAYAGVEVFYQNTLDSDPSWITEGEWAYGQPTGGGGAWGNPDPTSGYTGPNVYGYNLDGDYPDNLEEMHLTAGPFDCTGMEKIHLRFYRWLGVDKPPFDNAYVRASTDGVNWDVIWANSGVTSDEEWVEIDLDISTVADNQPVVYLRWTMGETNFYRHYCGWNIDDITLTRHVCEYSDCPADVNFSGEVDIDDLFAVLSHWDDGPGVYDINDDGVVDIDDVFAVLSDWGPCE